MGPIKFLEDAQHRIEAWRNDYNAQRLHTSIGNMTPNEYVMYAKNSEPIYGQIL
ncbi:MAG: transposase [Gammaproteobacteria bacterium]|nr:transposase [Gammaproteobacteria bacterium]